MNCDALSASILVDAVSARSTDVDLRAGAVSKNAGTEALRETEAQYASTFTALWQQRSGDWSP